MTTTKVHLTQKSTNKKTGPIPVSTSEASTCPSTCPLIDSGCYAKTGPLALHWRKVGDGERGMTWNNFCDTVKKLPRYQLWRHNQAGDLPHDEGVINRGMTERLVQANKGKNGFTYTHHDINKPENFDTVKFCNDNGFTVNLSGNNIDHAVVLADSDMPVVTIAPPEFWGENMEKKKRTVNGRTVIRCPAEYDKNTSCATCGVCAKADRKSIIAFTVHGTQKKKAAIIARG